MHLHRGNGFYPGTGDITDSGRGAGTGFNLNIPWQRGNLTDADYAAAFDLVSSAHCTYCGASAAWPVYNKDFRVFYLHPGASHWSATP